MNEYSVRIVLSELAIVAESQERDEAVYEPEEFEEEEESLSQAVTTTPSLFSPWTMIPRPSTMASGESMPGIGC